VQFWGKENIVHGSKTYYSQIDPIADVLTSSGAGRYLRTYDIGRGGRNQQLANVLIVVY
jgi:hypothetical protein